MHIHLCGEYELQPIFPNVQELELFNFLNNLASIWLLSYQHMLASVFMSICPHYRGHPSMIAPSGPELSPLPESCFGH